ncbi:RagB/SusD family nutrient uptake outer membrane protein [uncultured Algibacter sp.]|uniref:RagB/SusD family nutrient uptake outer membrane protein n=1 Tax=uncultured Algibacter sp. TaxID=298659 RepID=UPI00263167AB|nr:RagB/SusD family nutrient uptake outer membrane protein [uncultured Algibacter sp.]
MKKIFNKMKLKDMKNELTSLKVIILLIAVSLSSCEDFLEEIPETEVSGTVLVKDETTARELINGVYDPIGWGESSFKTTNHAYEFWFGDTASDDSEKGSTNGDQPGVTFLKDFTANGGNGNIGALWAKHWVVISRANEALTLLTSSEATISEDLKLELQGEAHFLRAYSYFTLVKIFGPVPLFDQPIDPDLLTARNFTKAKVGDIYTLIDADLRFAIENLPEKGVREFGRANKGSAAAYLARSIMYQLGTVNAQSYTWKNLLDITDDFIAQAYGSYSLEPNYALIHEVDHENGVESIFEIQAIPGSDWRQRGPYTGSQWTLTQSPQFMGGWGFNIPTQNLANAYAPNDARRPSVALAVGEYVYGVLMEESVRNNTGYHSRKAIMDPAIWNGGDDKASTGNIMKFRYADILLMNAEAAYHESKPGQARQRLIEIRARASASTYPIGFDPSKPNQTAATGFSPLLESDIPASGQQLLNFIYDERRRELAMEQLRFWDLVRTGRYISVMDNLYQTGDNIQEHTLADDEVYINPVPVFPIPSQDAVGWGIEQNRGY